MLILSRLLEQMVRLCIVTRWATKRLWTIAWIKSLMSLYFVSKPDVPGVTLGCPPNGRKIKEIHQCSHCNMPDLVQEPWSSLPESFIPAIIFVPPHGQTLDLVSSQLEPVVQVLQARHQ